MPKLTDEQIKKFKEAYGENVPTSKADIKPETELKTENVTPIESLIAGGTNIAGGLGENIVYPYIIKKIYKNTYNKELTDEQAQQLAKNYYEKAQEQNPVSYGTGVGVRELGSGALLGGATKLAKTLPGISKIADAANKERVAESLTSGLYGAGVQSIEGGDASDIATTGLGFAAMPEVFRGAGKLASKIPGFAKESVRVMTGTNPKLGEFIEQNPAIAQKITKQGAPTSEEIITNTIERVKPSFENMKFYMDANKYRREAVNHLKDEMYTYDPIKIANKIKDIKKDYPIGSPLTESTRQELNSLENFYKQSYFTEDAFGNKLPRQMNAEEIDAAINSLEKMAKNSYKNPIASDAGNKIRALASDLRSEVGRDVPGFDKYMKMAEQSVNKGNFLKQELGEVPKDYNWQMASQEEIGKIPISPQKLQTQIFDRPNKKIGTQMQRDETLRKMNQILPPQGRITQEDLLRVQGRKLMENPTAPGSGSAPVLTGGAVTLPLYYTLKGSGVSPDIASGVAAMGGLYAGNVLRTRGPEMATKGYMGIQKAEQNIKNFKQSSSDLIQRMIGTKYQKILQDAAAKGSKSFASTVFLLKTKDDNFRQMVNEINENENR